LIYIEANVSLTVARFIHASASGAFHTRQCQWRVSIRIFKIPPLSVLFLIILIY
jgi:hypothetical protein